MLLNPNDYEYEYFNQQRGRDGDSGSIYKAIPKRAGLCPLLVKSANESHSINELIGCHIGQRIGVNTPKAWLFEPVYYLPELAFPYHKAVGIEYLEGLTDGIKTDYNNEELLIQEIKGRILHQFLDESDGETLGYYNGKIYAYDFAAGVFPENTSQEILRQWYLPGKDKMGFSGFERMVFNREIYPRRAINRYMKQLVEKGVDKDLLIGVYSEMREKLIQAIKEDGFMDLVTDITMVFSEDTAYFVKYLIDNTCQVLIDFPEPLGMEVDYMNTKDNVRIMVDKSKMEKQK